MSDKLKCRRFDALAQWKRTIQATNETPQAIFEALHKKEGGLYKVRKRTALHTLHSEPRRGSARARGSKHASRGGILLRILWGSTTCRDQEQPRGRGETIDVLERRPINPGATAPRFRVE
jgi:hypothetical protein